MLCINSKWIAIGLHQNINKHCLGHIYVGLFLLKLKKKKCEGPGTWEPFPKADNKSQTWIIMITTDQFWQLS